MPTRQRGGSVQTVADVHLEQSSEQSCRVVEINEKITKCQRAYRFEPGLSLG